jgi:hypothetical protein
MGACAGESVVGLKEQHTERKEEGKQTLGVEHEGRSHVVRDPGREDTVKTEPDESLNELMHGEERRERCEEELSAGAGRGSGW